MFTLQTIVLNLLHLTLWYGGVTPAATQQQQHWGHTTSEPSFVQIFIATYLYI